MNKSTIIFILSIIGIIAIYFVFLNNIFNFTLDYNGELLSYQNKYDIEDKKQKIKQYLENSETARVLVSDELDNILTQNKRISDVYMSLLGINGEVIEEYVKINDNKVVTNTKYGDIISIPNIVFTNDFKNFYFHSGIILDTVELPLENIPEEINKNKETFLAEIGEKLKATGILQDNVFTPTSILVQKLNINLKTPTMFIGSNTTSTITSVEGSNFYVEPSLGYSYVYVVEDTNNDIKVLYDLSTKRILEIITGFN